MSTPVAVGVDVGATKTTAALVDVTGRVGPVASLPTPATAGAAAVVDTVVRLVHEVLVDVEGPARAGVGIGSAGVVEPTTGRITAATDHIAGWAGTPLQAMVAQATGLPVAVVNDAHAHALGEAAHGAGRGRQSLLLVAAGTGLGGAYVLDGRVVVGAHGAAGHLGHVPCAEAAGMRCACGGLGHLECVASGQGVVTLARGRGLEVENAPDLARRAVQGDDVAASVLATSGGALGAAIGGWVNTLDPDVVVVTGGLSAAGPLWWEALHAAAVQVQVPATRACPVVPARLGPTTAIVGAALLMLERSMVLS